jgi:hypothetical protein
MAGEGHVKGTLLVHLRAHVLEVHGAAAWTDVVASLADKDRGTLDGLLVNGSWYPVRVWNVALREHLAKHATDSRAEVLALARRVADADLHTVFKILLKVASAEAILRRAGWLWERYFDRGGMATLEDGQREFRVHLTAPTAEADGAGSPTCTYGVVGWLSHAMSLVGVKNVQIAHTRCRFAHARHCEYRVLW